MTDDEVRNEMAALAGRLLVAEPGLALTTEGLREAEAGFAGLHEKHGRQPLGAFLGETIVALGGGAVRWVSFETAAAANRQIAALGKDDQTQAVLSVGTSFWFPHVKVAKRKLNGPSESLVAFGGVVLAQVAPRSPAPARSPSSFTRADFPDDAWEAAEAFVRTPSPETLKTFNDKVSSRINREQYEPFFRLLGLRAAPLLAQLAVPDQGRGLKRTSFSGIAAHWVAHLLDTGVESASVLDEVRPRLADPSACARESAARILMQAAIRRRDFQEASGLVIEVADKARLQGAFFGLAVQLAREKERAGRTARFEVTPLMPLLLRGLAGDQAIVAETLGIIHDLVKWSDVSPVMTSALCVLDRKEPALLESALHLVTTYAFRVAHDGSPYLRLLEEIVPKIVEMTKANPGAKKITRVQIAARYALSPLDKLGRHFDPTTREAVRQGLEAAKHIR